MKNNSLIIPSREEFHRLANNILAECDFSTEYCPEGFHIKRYISSKNFDKAIKFKRNKNYSWR